MGVASFDPEAGLFCDCDMCERTWSWSSSVQAERALSRDGAAECSLAISINASGYLAHGIARPFGVRNQMDALRHLEVCKSGLAGLADIFLADQAPGNGSTNAITASPQSGVRNADDLSVVHARYFVLKENLDFALGDVLSPS